MVYGLLINLFGVTNFFLVRSSILRWIKVEGALPLAPVSNRRGSHCHDCVGQIFHFCAKIYLGHYPLLFACSAYVFTGRCSGWNFMSRRFIQYTKLLLLSTANSFSLSNWLYKGVYVGYCRHSLFEFTVFSSNWSYHSESTPPIVGLAYS